MGSPSTPAANAAGYAVQFQTQNIAPPSSIYFTPDDQLFLFVVPSVVCTLRVVVRYLLPSGEVKIGEYPVITVATRSPQLQIQNLGEGFILGINVYCHTQALRRGQCWVKFVLIRGGLNTQELSQTICQGYVTEYTSLFWPSAQTDYELSGRGNIRSITGTTPGAGAEISETVPTGAVWQLLTFSFTFVASGAVATRIPELKLDDGANIFASLPIPNSVTAGGGVIMSFGEGLAFATDGNVHNTSPLPLNVLLPAGFRIRTVTGSIQAADQYSAVEYLVEEWLQP